MELYKFMIASWGHSDTSCRVQLIMQQSQLPLLLLHTTDSRGFLPNADSCLIDILHYSDKRTVLASLRIRSRPLQPR